MIVQYDFIQCFLKSKPHFPKKWFLFALMKAFSNDETCLSIHVQMFTFLSQLFGLVEKRLDKKAITDVTN